MRLHIILAERELCIFGGEKMKKTFFVLVMAFAIGSGAGLAAMTIAGALAQNRQEGNMAYCTLDDLNAAYGEDRIAGVLESDPGGKAVLEQVKIARQYLTKVAEGKFAVPGYNAGTNEVSKPPTGGVQARTGAKLDLRGY
jgi:hypothetical protein